MKKVMVFGTFDILHPGHISLFEQAKKHGDFLIVVVAKDVNVERLKGKFPQDNEHKRLLNVYNDLNVDLAVLGNKEDPYKIIEEQKPDVICLGYDQNSYTENLEKELQNRGIKLKIIRLESHHPDKFKSSKINPSSS